MNTNSDSDSVERAFVRRLIYVSHAEVAVDATIIASIIDQSQRRNGRDGITGALLHSSHYFCQWIEGPEDAIEALYVRLLKDPRHRIERLVADGPVRGRKFDRWSMLDCLGSTDVRGLDVPLANLRSLGVAERLFELSSFETES